MAVLGAYALVGGALSLLGWVANVERLTDWFNNGISIQPNSTVAVVLSGIAVLALGRGRTRIAAVLGLVVAFIGFTALVQYLVAGDYSRLNTLLLFDRPWGRTGVVDPGRMGPPGATSWTLVGIALILADSRRADVRRLATRLALVTLAVAAFSFAGYFYGVGRLYSLPYLTVIAFQTATFIAAVSLGIVAALPEQPPARWFLAQGATGAVARRAVPLIIVLPFAAGWIR